MIPTVDRLEERTLLAAISWNGGNGNWNVAGNWTPAQVPNSNDTVTISASGSVVNVTDAEIAINITTTAGTTLSVATSGSLHFTTAAVAGSFNSLAGASISVGTSFNVSGTSLITGTAFNNTGINNSGSLTLNGSIIGGTSTNTGTLIVEGGTTIDNSSSLTNAAGATITFSDQTGIADSNQRGGSLPALINSGTMILNGGSGTSVINGVQFEDLGGTINVQAGTLSDEQNAFFQGAIFDISSGAAFAFDPISSTNSADQFYFSGTSTGSGAGHLLFNGASVEPGNPSVAATTAILNFPAGLAQVTGTSFVANSQDGAVQEVTNNGFLNFVGTATHGDLGLINNGTIQVTGTGDIGVDSSGGFTNDTTGVLDFAADASLISLGGNSGVQNMGTIEKTAGTGTSSINFSGYDTGGTINAQTGTIDYPAGYQFDNTTFIAAAGATISLDLDGAAFGNGAGYLFAGTLTGSGAGNLLFASDGAHTGNDIINVTTGAILNFPAGFAQVTGFVFQGSGSTQIVNQGYLDYTGTDPHGDASLDNKGTIRVIGTGDLISDSNGGFINDTTGVLNFETDAGVTDNGNTSFTNLGLIEKTGGAGNTIIGTGIDSIGLLSNDGTYDVESGTLTLADGGGIFDFAVGAAPISTAPGTVFAIGGDAHVEGDPTIIGGGTFEVTTNGALQGPSNDSYESSTTPAVLDFDPGTFIVAGGNLSDSQGLINTGTIEYEGASELDGIDNKGVITLDAGPLRVAGNIVNDVGGILEFTGAQQILALGNNGLLSNAGSLILNPGAGQTFDLSQINAINTGTIYFESGTINLPWIPNQYVPSPGLFTNGAGIAAGSTFVIDPGVSVTVDTTPTFSQLNGTLILGGAGATFPAYSGLTTVNGTLAVLSGATFTTSGALANSGTLSVGGTVTVAGTYTQGVNPDVFPASTATPTLDFQIAAAPGSAAAPDFTVTGAATLAGDLTADYVNGFTGSGGAYTVATFTGGSTGTFASTAGTAPFFTPTVSSNQIVLNGHAFTGTGGSTPLPVAPTVSTPTPITSPSPTPTTPADLTVSAVTAPATFAPGSQQTITWTVTNAGTGAAAGSWEDSVFLSANGTIDSSSVLIGRVTHTGTLEAGANYAGTLTAFMPPVAGAYTVLVETDSRGAVTNNVRTGGVATSGTTTAVIPTLIVGTATTGTISYGQQLLYALTLPALTDVSLAATFGVALTANLYVKAGAVPTPASYDFAYTSTTATATSDLLHAAQPTTYYILLYGRVAAALTPQSFSIAPMLVTYGPVAISPSSGITSLMTTVTITGVGFTPSTTVSLSLGSTSTPATSVTFVNGNTLYATFNLSTSAAGAYDVTTSEGTAGPTAALPGAFAVTPYHPSGSGGAATSPGRLVFSLSAPTYIRVGTAGTLTLFYENAGGSDIAAPLFDVSGANTSFRVSGESSPYVDGGIEVLGISQSGPAGVLAAGQSGAIQIDFTQDAPGAHVVSKFSATVGGPTETIFWLAVKGYLRPATEPEDAWDAIFANFLNDVGTSEGQFQGVLDNDATYLGTLGDRTPDVGRLEYFQLQQEGNFGIIGHSYGLGAFGRGQADPYNRLLSVDAMGNVTVGDGGIPGQVSSVRIFTIVSPGVYAAEPGDGGTLTDNAGIYTLTEADGSLTVFNANGTVNYFQDPHGNRTTATETTVAFNLPLQIDNAMGVEVPGNATGSANLITQLTAANGDTIKLAYNGEGLVSSLTDAVGQVSTYTYDPNTEDLLSISGPAGTTSFTYYPGNSHQVQTATTPTGAVTSYTYDGKGRLLTVATDGTDSITYSYDQFGNVGITTATGQVVETYHGEDGSIVAVENAAGGKERYTYDAADDLTSVTGLDGTESTIAYGSNGLVASTTDAGGGTQSITYTSAGLPATETDADNNTTTFTYDSAGDVLTAADPAGATQTFTYSPSGAQLTAASAAGRNVTNTYSTAGLLMSQAFSDGSSTSYTYDPHRNLLTASNAAGTESFTYDSDNRLTSVTYPNGTSLTYTYNAGGQLVQKVDQSGYTTRYTYTAAGQLAETTNGTGGMIAAYTYNAAGAVSQVDFGNGTATTYSYDRDGNITSVTNLNPAEGVLASFAYTYNADAQVATMITAAGTTSYIYNALGELVRAVLPGSRTITYAYDAEGNRTSVIDSGTSTSYTTNQLNQYTAVGATTYTYDADGNLTTSTTSAGTTTYTYDVQDRLVSISGPTGTTSYTYDALGNRIATTVNGVTTKDLVDPSEAGDLAGQFTTSGATIDQYNYGLGLTSQTGTSGTDFYAFDAQGNTADLTGPTGAVVNAYSYLPFGQILTATGSAANPFTFDGQEGVTGAGGSLYLTRTRLYDSATGRFTQRDKLGLGGGTTNLYKYANNDPIDESDPSGDNAAAAAGALFRAKFGFLPLGPAQNAIAEDLLANSVATAATAEDLALSTFLSSVANAVPSAEAGVNLPAVFTGIGQGGEIIDAGVQTGAFVTAAGVYGPTSTLAATTTGGVISTASTAATVTFGTVLFAIEGPIGAVVVGNKINNEYNLENPNGTPIQEQEVINTSTYNQILRRPGLAAFLKDLADVNGGPLTPDQITEAIQIYAHTDLYSNPNPANTQTQAVSSHDPNSITGPSGYGPAGYILPVTTLPYEIDFTNAATASAPAQTVTITQTLDPNLDLSTFQLGTIGFGSTTINLPAGLQTYTTTVAVSSTLNVVITADLNPITRIVTWTFTSIDPATGDAPSNPLAGFLPPDVTDPEGSGFVDYTVQPIAGLATGATISAQASIVFDTNAAIATPVVLNTIDAGSPTVSVGPLVATQSGIVFPLSWSGSDDVNGSGIASYTVYVSVDGGAYAEFLTATTATTADYIGSPGHTYGFVVQAVDNVGNESTFPAAAEATTAIPAIDRTIAFSKGHPARFTDAAGAIVVITLSGPGSGTISFISMGNADPVSLVLTGTTARSSVSVHVSRGVLTLGTVMVNGSLATFSAAHTSFIGSFAVTGTLANLLLGDEAITEATLTIGGASVPTSIRMGVVHDLALTDAAAIKSLTVTSWTDGLFDTDSIIAPSIGVINVTGNFDPSLSLTGAGLDLRSINVRGMLSGTWTFTGSAGQITAAATTSTWAPTVAGSITGLTIRGAMSGTLAAKSVGNFRVGGNLSDAMITLSGTTTQLGRTDAIKSLTVTGSVLNSDIMTQGNIGVVMADGFSDSEVFAGVVAGTTTLPAATSTFADSSSIASVHTRGKSAFADTLIAAAAIGSVALVNVTTDNSGTVFGVAAESLKSFSLSQPKQKIFNWNSKKPVSLLSTLPGDLRVSIV